MATYKGHNEDSSGNILLSIGNGMTATVETGSTASQAYTKGAYIFFNNRFCKATSAIASGATLAIGTNLSETTVGQELTNHLRSSDGNEFYFDVKDGAYGYYPSASKVASEFVPFGGTGLALDGNYIVVSRGFITNGQIVCYTDVANGVATNASYTTDGGSASLSLINLQVASGNRGPVTITAKEACKVYYTYDGTTTSLSVGQSITIYTPWNILACAIIYK